MLEDVTSSVDRGLGRQFLQHLIASKGLRPAPSATLASAYRRSGPVPHERRREIEQYRANGVGLPGQHSPGFPERASQGVNPRKVAVEQLLRIEEEGAYVGLVGRHKPVSGSQRNGLGRLSEAGQRRVTELVASVTRLRRRLDWRLSQLAAKPITHPVLLQVMRLALYEMFEADMPAHAQGAYVELAKEMVGPWCTSFANGVLRSARRILDKGDLLIPGKPPTKVSRQALADVMGTVYSHPTWLVAKWIGQFGEQATEELLLANNRPPPHGVRANTLRKQSSASLLRQLRHLDVAAAPSTFLPDEFLRVEKGLQHILRAGLMREGSCMVQDEAAGLVVALLDPKPGEAILDACAAPGGKTLFIAARMRNQGSLLAMDVNAKRLQALSKAADASGVGPMLSIRPGSIQAMAADHGFEPSVKRLADTANAAAEQPCDGLDAESTEAVDFYGAEDAAARFWIAASEPNMREEAALSGDSIRSGTDERKARGNDEASDTCGSARGWANGEQAAPPSAALPRGNLGGFDRVLLDAPCSGHGVLAKRADLRWRRQQQDLSDLVELQAEMLAAAASLVRPGGLLVYSTCSIEPEENEQQVVDFVRSHPEFQAEAAPAGSLPPEVVNDEGFLATLPHVHGIDGAFGARLRRRARSIGLMHRENDVC